MKGYIIDYINENEFKKLERALKKYNMLAYKKLNFEYYLLNFLMYISLNYKNYLEYNLLD